MPDRQLKGKKNTGKAVVSLKKTKKNNKKPGTTIGAVL